MSPATVSDVARKDAVSEEKEELIAIDQFVRHLIAEDVKSWTAKKGKDRGANPDIAQRVGVSVPTVHDVRQNKKAAGPTFAAGYAKARGQSLNEFRAEAVAWWRANGEPGPTPAPSTETDVGHAPARWVERDNVLADQLVADLIRGGHMGPELIGSVRPRIVLALGQASDGSVPGKDEQARVALAALADARESPLVRPVAHGEPIPGDSGLREPRPETIEIPKKRGGKR